MTGSFPARVGTGWARPRPCFWGGWLHREPEEPRDPPRPPAGPAASGPSWGGSSVGYARGACARTRAPDLGLVAEAVRERRCGGAAPASGGEAAPPLPLLSRWRSATFGQRPPPSPSSTRRRLVSSSARAGRRRAVGTPAYSPPRDRHCAQHRAHGRGKLWRAGGVGTSPEAPSGMEGKKGRGQRSGLGRTGATLCGAGDAGR